MPTAESFGQLQHFNVRLATDPSKDEELGEAKRAQVELNKIVKALNNLISM